MPIMFGGTKSVVASYLQLPVDQLDNTRLEYEAEKLGIEITNSLGCITLLDMIPYCSDIRDESKSDTKPDGTIRTIRTISTPRGVMQEIRDKPLTYEAGPLECFVKSEEDLPAFEYFIRTAVDAMLTNPKVHEDLFRQASARKCSMSDRAATVWSFWTPCFELTCTNFMMPDTAIYLLYDYPDLMEDLMKLLWEKDRQLILPLGLELDADLYLTAINGLEWYSPELYEQYMTPQGKQTFDWIRQNDRLSWLHTCGKMNKLVETGVYDIIRPDILESFSTPPLGDVADLRQARRRLGDCVVTKGGINVEVLYAGTPEEVRAHVRNIAEATRGYRHIIGDTNSHFYGDPPDNILALIDEVHKQRPKFE
jgi:hypothetical protein